MSKNKKLGILAIVLAFIIIGLIVLMVWGLSHKKTNTKPGNDASIAEVQKDDDGKGKDDSNIPDVDVSDPNEPAPAQGSETTEDTKVYTPTFMYFVSNNDATFEAEMNVFNELKTEYDGKVNFDLCNIDEDPERAANFKMGDNTTPYLIMLNTKNDICALEFVCADKTKLKEDIEKALNGTN